MKTRIALAAIALAFTAAAGAQNYPTKPIRLIVPFAAGGTVDISARGIAPGLSELLGQNVIVDNRGGAGGIIGADLVAKAAPDGYTLLMGSNSTVSVAPSLYPKNPYHPVRDFAPISLVATTPFVLVAHPSVPAKTVKELIALARSKPGRLTMASGGTGSSNHLVGELFQSLTGTKLTHVPYKGAAPAGVDLMAGQVDLLFDQLPTSVGPAKAGKFRALAVTSKARAAVLPEVPTMLESGMPNFEVINITGVLAPAGTPADILEKLNAATLKVLSQPAVRERFAAIALEARGGTPGEFAAFIKEDFARWTKVVKEANIKVE
ncbi:MAG: tripartite tricarboxylate transporter substrate binding protein [Betaproteobacteria bacterium]|nr:MAG: tripartite tricarboxylate transporter substrate binding protein [Betaproteobacteria bacterium]